MRFPTTLSCWFICLAGSVGLCQERQVESQSNTYGPAGNEQVESVFKNFKPRGVQRDDSQPTPALQAVKKFVLPTDLKIELVASEPNISQPLFVSFDSRGRMWVVQYRQYQYPAGLKVIRFDQHLRAVFDRVPEPPPTGTPGLDRISVFEDTDADGYYDAQKDVITGLNIATSVQVGPRGIWVLNPPYLLHYPDADRDDVPDGPPEVHLSGFGLQDTHSVANSLRWGPDGWLYGANGSTTAGTISSQKTKGVQFEGQCIWRYHPVSQEFEIYAEGGGNTFSLEIDSKGQVFSGTNGGNKRGYYYPQGSYSDKNWGKHGPLTNPFAYGYFRGMSHAGDKRRFAQAYAIYESDLLPARFQGTVIAPNSLHNIVWNSRLENDGTNFRTIDLDNLLVTSDRWFRPVHCCVGPEGAIYLADWYDTRLSHVSPIDDWHKESGRIYRIVPDQFNGHKPLPNLSSLPDDALIGNFDSDNKWLRQRSSLELGWRDLKDQTVGQLCERVSNSGCLESLWSLSVANKLTTESCEQWINHEKRSIRQWTIRLLGDRREFLPALAERARIESSPRVRAQLASSARRWSSDEAIKVIRGLLTQEDDASDPHLPLLYWWAIETHADDWQAMQALTSSNEFLASNIAKNTVLSRLARRLAVQGGPQKLQQCAELLRLAPDVECAEQVLLGLNQAFEGRPLPELPASLAAELDKQKSAVSKSALLLELRTGKPDAILNAIASLRDAEITETTKTAIVRTLADLQAPSSVSPILKIALGKTTQQDALRRVAMASLAKFDAPEIGPTIVAGLASSISATDGLRDIACRTLAARPANALLLLKELQQWRLKKSDIPLDVLQQLRNHRNPEIVSITESIFGKVGEVSSQEQIAEIKRLQKVLQLKTGNQEAGKRHFMEKCGVCHSLFGEGKSVGPPLDGYARDRLSFWLPAIITPSIEIREGYQSFAAIDKDDKVITGMVAAEDTKSVTLLTADAQRVLLQKDQLLEYKALKQSLMPADTLKEMTDEQIADLFAYLQLGARGS